MKINKKLALIYGVLLGDGCISKVGKHHYFLEIAGNMKDDLPFLNKIKPIIEDIRGKKIKIKKRGSMNELEISFCDKKMFSLFKELGLPVGKKGPKLLISKKFGRIFYKEIIQGYFATDGCLVITNNNGILYPRIEFSSISRDLLQQVLSYLKEKGMNGAVYVSHRYKDKKTLYRIQFNGKNNLLKFIDKIGFVNPKHKEKYEKWKKSGGADI